MRCELKLFGMVSLVEAYCSLPCTCWERISYRWRLIERKSSYSCVIQGRETIVLITQLKFKMETTRLVSKVKINSQGRF